MKKMSVIVLLIGILGMVSCGGTEKDPIQLVKNAIFDVDSSRTLGVAVANNPFFNNKKCEKQPEWNVIENTDNTIVTLTVYPPNLEEIRYRFDRRVYYVTEAADEDELYDLGIRGRYYILFSSLPITFAYLAQNGQCEINTADYPGITAEDIERYLITITELKMMEIGGYKSSHIRYVFVLSANRKKVELSYIEIKTAYPLSAFNLQRLEEDEISGDIYGLWSNHIENMGNKPVFSINLAYCEEADSETQLEFNDNALKLLYATDTDREREVMHKLITGMLTDDVHSDLAPLSDNYTIHKNVMDIILPEWFEFF